MRMLEKEGLDLSVIMPCLNEEKTVGICIDEAKSFMNRYQIKGEVLVVDNASEDDSVVAAKKQGARVIREKKKGYGNAIRAGMQASCGKILIIGDCDTTYDFLRLENMYRPLAEGKCDMIIGNRYAGGMEKGSMPRSHRLGVRFLSFCGRIRFHTDVYDFHCGLRGISRSAAEKMTLQTEGMEFATEMIAEAVEKQLRIQQIPVKLKKCNYERKSKLRTVLDGIRHLKYILSKTGRENEYEQRN